MTIRLLLVSALALVLVLAACSDDDPVAPPCLCEDGVIEIPGEVATLAEAVAIASDGDTLKIAGGAYAADVTVDKALVIVAERDDVSWPILVTEDGPFSVELDHGRLELKNLAFSGGETGLALELDDAEVVAWKLDIGNTIHGITVDGDGGLVTIAEVDFHDIGDDNGNGMGLRVWGDNRVFLGGTFTDTGGGSGVAATVSDESNLLVEYATFTGFDAGNAAVLACTGNAHMSVGFSRFERCSGTLIHGAGDFGGLAGVDFTNCSGTLVRLLSDGEPMVLSCDLLDCTGTFLELGEGQTPIMVSGCSVVDHEGTVVEVGDAAELSLLDWTVVGVDGSLVSSSAGGEVRLSRCLVVDGATPVVVGGTIDVGTSDFWRSDGTDAWVGLEAFRGVEGNIEADPLFCDAAGGDFRVELGSPCNLGGAMVIGAFAVGCE